MSIEFRCSHCHKLLRVPDDSGGRQAQCPQCGAIVSVPVPDAPAAMPPPAFPDPWASPPAPMPSAPVPPAPLPPAASDPWSPPESSVRPATGDPWAALASATTPGSPSTGTNPFASSGGGPTSIGDALSTAGRSPPGQDVNPYASPASSSYYAPPSAPINPAQRIYGPALALLIMGWLCVVLQIVAMGFLVVALVVDPPQGMNGDQAMVQLGINGGTTAFQLIMTGIIIYGATQMKNLQNYGMSMAAAIIAMIPCVSPCCLLGLPFGIWALVILSEPEVKNAFR